MKTQTNADSESNTAALRPGFVRTSSKTIKNRHERRKIRAQLRRLDPAAGAEDDFVV
jgi:hypothetical protein